jgi:hypothetical protein
METKVEYFWKGFVTCILVFILFHIVSLLGGEFFG